MEMENFRLAAVGGLADAIEQVKQWHEGLRVQAPDAEVVPLRSDEEEAWDLLIHSASDYPHRGTGNACKCHLCRPNRLYR